LPARPVAASRSSAISWFIERSNRQRARVLRHEDHALLALGGVREARDVGQLVGALQVAEPVGEDLDLDRIAGARDPEMAIGQPLDAGHLGRGVERAGAGTAGTLVRRLEAVPRLEPGTCDDAPWSGAGGSAGIPPPGGVGLTLICSKISSFGKKTSLPLPRSSRCGIGRR